MSLIPTLIEPVSKILDKFVQDKDEKARLAHEIATLAERQAHEIAVEQIKTNREEAKSHSLFVAGWRPAIGWICAVGFGCNFILVPLGNFALLIAGMDIVLPMVDLSTMLPVLMGMLGLGAMRTVEKARGVQRDK